MNHLMNSCFDILFKLNIGNHRLNQYKRFITFQGKALPNPIQPNIGLRVNLLKEQGPADAKQDSCENVIKNT